MRSYTRILATAVALLFAIGCSPGPPSELVEDSWAGTITTDGNVTTVVNESGSVWGGTATLVEEASIGVDAGDAHYMLGAIGGVFFTDNRIYVLDSQVPIIRAYDLAGAWVGDIGRRGQGPGEFVRPTTLSGNNDGLIVLQEDEIRRLMVFSESGEYVATLPSQDIMCCRWAPVPTPRGTFWARTRVRGESAGVRGSGSGGGAPVYAVQEHGPEGPVGEPRFPEIPDFELTTMQIEVRGRQVAQRTPFSPASDWAVAPSGAIVVGASDRYRFEIQGAAGSVISVERAFEPVAIDPDEAEWHRRLIVSVLRLEAASPDFIWDGAEMPAAKPAFGSLVPVASGDVWVLRQGPGRRLADCVEDPLAAGYRAAVQAPCWRDTTLIDVFDAEGRHLGDVAVPSGMQRIRANLFVRGDQMVGVVEDEAGTLMVKRFRLVRPE